MAIIALEHTVYVDAVPALVAALRDAYSIAVKITTLRTSSGETDWRILSVPSAYHARVEAFVAGWKARAGFDRCSL